MDSDSSVFCPVYLKKNCKLILQCTIALTFSPSIFYLIIRFNQKLLSALGVTAVNTGRTCFNSHTKHIYIRLVNTKLYSHTRLPSVKTIALVRVLFNGLFQRVQTRGIFRATKSFFFGHYDFESNTFTAFTLPSTSANPVNASTYVIQILVSNVALQNKLNQRQLFFPAWGCSILAEDPMVPHTPCEQRLMIWGEPFENMKLWLQSVFHDLYLNTVVIVWYTETWPNRASWLKKDDKFKSCVLYKSF